MGPARARAGHTLGVGAPIHNEKGGAGPREGVPPRVRVCPLLCSPGIRRHLADRTGADDRSFEHQCGASTTLAELVHDHVLLARIDHVGLGHYGRVPVATAYECLNRTANRPPPSWSPYFVLHSRIFMRGLSLYTSTAALGFLLYFLYAPHLSSMVGRWRSSRIEFEGKGKDC